MSNELKPCPICSKKVEPWARELRSIYNLHGIGSICASCGDKADSFVGYWGHKNQEDKNKLFDFINGGDLLRRKFSSLMNAGYF
jgi:bacterioferritin-associated ferredoxin